MILIKIISKSGEAIVPLESSIVTHNYKTGYTTFSSLNGNVLISAKIDYGEFVSDMFNVVSHGYSGVRKYEEL